MARPASYSSVPYILLAGGLAQCLFSSASPQSTRFSPSRPSEPRTVMVFNLNECRPIFEILIIEIMLYLRTRKPSNCVETP